MDVVDKSTRSRMMSTITGRNTKPEITVRKFLHARGYRFRLHKKDLPGRPDIVLPKWKTCIFVHGCFWHRHANCRYAATPKTRPEFWAKKFRENVARDQRNMDALHAAGWRCYVVWECELRSSEDRLELLVHQLGMGG